MELASSNSIILNKLNSFFEESFANINQNLDGKAH